METGRLARSLLGVGLTALLSVSPLGAASDLPLIHAIRNQDGAAARALVEAGADVNVRQLDGATALHWAVHWEDRDTTALLINAGANVDTANDLGVTPLLMACTSGNAALVETLLQAGANPRDALSSGETALMLASRAGTARVVEDLLARGADVNAVERTRSQTALMWAIANRHPDVTKALLDHGANINARSQVRVRVFSMGGSRGAGSASSGIVLTEIPLGGSTPLLFAARSGDVESAKLLVAAGAGVRDVGVSAGPGSKRQRGAARLHGPARGRAQRDVAGPWRPEHRSGRRWASRQDVVGARRRPERPVHKRDTGTSLEPRLRFDGPLGRGDTVLAGCQVPRDRDHGRPRGSWC
jgi:ankyrin repeat protein